VLLRIESELGEKLTFLCHCDGGEKEIWYWDGRWRSENPQICDCDLGTRNHKHRTVARHQGTKAINFRHEAFHCRLLYTTKLGSHNILGSLIKVYIVLSRKLFVQTHQSNMNSPPAL